MKRRGKYNKDKAGNLGKLGRKAMKEVKVEQVTVVVLRMYTFMVTLIVLMR